MGRLSGSGASNCWGILEMMVCGAREFEAFGITVAMVGLEGFLAFVASGTHFGMAKKMCCWTWQIPTPHHDVH